MTSLIHGDARLVDAATGAVLAGPDLADAVAAAAEVFAGFTPGAAFVRVPTDTTGIVRYLGAWAASRPVALLDPALAASTLSDLIGRFQPAVVVGLDAEPAAAIPPVPAGYRAQDTGLGPAWVRAGEPDVPPHPDLAVLLATSGSTGSPKFVRLSRTAVASNAQAIADVLRLGPDEVAPTTLATFYSYGMSVVNSHLLVGASLLVERGGMTQRPFWSAVTEHGVTSMAAVPYQYEMLRRLGFKPGEYPTLRTLTQAGGRLRPEFVTDFHDRMAEHGGRMYVMYGQTEASPRMTTLPAERLIEKLGSVGPALSGGHLSIRPLDGAETVNAGITGEVLYRGPNVMMGYAESVGDLARGDDHQGLLETGDLGHLDDEGYLFLQGRTKRIGKVFGVRLNLDDIESMVADGSTRTVAAVSHNDTIVVWAEGLEAESRRSIASELAERLGLHRTGFKVREIDALPLLANGKVDYQTLEKLA